MITRRVKMRQRLRKAYLDGGGHDEVAEALSGAESEITVQDNVTAETNVTAEASGEPADERRRAAGR